MDTASFVDVPAWSSAGVASPALTYRRMKLSGGLGIIVLGAAGDSTTGAVSVMADELRLATLSTAPAFQLRVCLSRAPDPEIADVVPLIEGARLVLRATLGLSADELASAEDMLGRSCRLVRFEEMALTLEVSTATGPMSLAAPAADYLDALITYGQLTRDPALEVLRALHSGSSRARLRARWHDATSAPKAMAGLPAPPGAPQGWLTAWQRLEVVTPLERLIFGLDPAAVIQLLSPDPADPSRLVQVPARQTAGRQPTTRAMPGEKERIMLALIPGAEAPRALALALQPDERLQASPHVQLASDTLRLGGAQTWLASDIVTEPALAARVLHLPIVSDVAAASWSDRADVRRRFYAPHLSLMKPQPADPPERSAFSFRMEQSGFTAGPSPKPGLRALVRFRLRWVPSDATRFALIAAGNPPAEPVSTRNLSATLEVPFRKDGSASVAIQAFAGAVTLDGNDVVVAVELLDDWVRLLYGSLAYPDFQQQPARLSLAYAFPAYVPLKDFSISASLTNKLSKIAIAEHATRSADVAGPSFETATRRLRFAGGTLEFPMEAATGARTSRAPAAGAVGLARIHAGSFQTSVPAASILVRPALEPPAAFQPARLPQFATRTIVHQLVVDVSFPCVEFGNFFLEATAVGDRALGCRDALRLGEISYRQYDELPDLRGKGFRVYRSLQQPGRFLVCPDAYRVTRYAASESPERAYRPVMMVYALIGDVPGETRYFITATLEPDVSYASRRSLLRTLTRLTPAGSAPVLDFPTDPVVQASFSFAWSLPSGMAAPGVTLASNAFLVSLSADLADGVVLKELIEHSGVNGSVLFTLADGMQLNCRLSIDTVVAGPWEGGPLQLEQLDGSLTISNPLKQQVDVRDVTLLRGDSTQSVPGGGLLPAGASRTLSIGTAADDVWADASASRASTLDELQVFEEDVTANVIFVNQVNYANGDVVSLGVQLRLEGSSKTYFADLPEASMATVDVVFPLTTYLRAQIIHFQITTTLGDGSSSTTEPITWDLGMQGSVVGVTSPMIFTKKE